MRRTRVIELEPKERILQKAKHYIESLDSFFDEGEQAISVLLKALKYADRELKREIMLLLGSFAKEESVWPLYDLMTDPSEDEEIRRDASIQLSVVGSLLKDPQPLLERLLREIESTDAERSRIARTRK